MKRVLVLAAVGEAATGVALLIVPSLVGQLLLGAELTGVAVTVARVAGIALIALGVACWPGPPLLGMLTYSAAVTLYLAYVGFAGGSTGVLLWPAVVLHVILTALLARAVTQRQGGESIEAPTEARHTSAARNEYHTCRRRRNEDETVRTVWGGSRPRRLRGRPGTRRECRWVAGAAHVRAKCGGSPDDAAASTFRLVKVNPQTVYFSDRPQRIAGNLKMADYLKTWKEGRDNSGPIRRTRRSRYTSRDARTRRLLWSRS